MKPVPGTVTDPAIHQQYLGTSFPATIGFDYYAQKTDETAVYPRLFTEGQVRAIMQRAYGRGSFEFDAPSPAEIDRWIDHDFDAITTPFNRLVYPVLGLVGEAGEIANKLKKCARDEMGAMGADKVADLLDETGDVQWYVARVVRELRSSLGVVARNNLVKLFSRKKRGVIGGSGDKR